MDARDRLVPTLVDRSWSEVLRRAPELATAGPATIDGYGAFRAADGLLASFAGRHPEPPLRYRPATRADSDLLLVWRNDPGSGPPRAPRRWCPPPSTRLGSRTPCWTPARTLLVVENVDKPVGTVRFDDQPNRAEISVTIARPSRGEGIGSRVISEASELYLSSHPDISSGTGRGSRAKPRLRRRVRARRLLPRAGSRPRLGDACWPTLSPDLRSAGRREDGRFSEARPSW